VRRRVLVETDFLFGLNARDKLYPYVTRLLEKHRKGELMLSLSSVSSLEATLVLLSRGFKARMVIRILRLMNTKLSEYNIDSYTPLSLKVIAEALELKEKYKQLTFFDSIHIATAKTMGLPLVTSDKTLARIMKAESIEYLEYKDVA